jgi:hypothetical protein
MTTTAAITYQVKPYPHEVALLHSWTITAVDGTVISELYVDMNTLEIRQIETHPDHRGEGHATALWHAAQTQMSDQIRHSHEAHRTDDGNRFAARVGGDTAPCTNDCRCDDTDD